MKKFRDLGAMLLMVVVALAAFSIMDAMSASGMTMAIGTVVAGGTVTEKAATDDSYDENLNIADVERKVLEYKSYKTPLISLIQKVGTSPVESAVAKYYAVDSRGMSTNITSATAINSNETTLTVADSSIFTLRNTVVIPSVGGNKVSSGRELVGYVISKPATGKITLYLFNAAPSLSESDITGEVYRLGSAQSETAAQADVFGLLPESDYNYVQLFMEQIEESEFQKLMKKEADWGYGDLKRLAIEDFKMQRERTFLNGLRGEHTITINGKTEKIYTCGGILNDTNIPVISSFNLSDFESNPQNFIPIIKSAFTGNNGSKERYMFLGADFAESLEKANIAKVSKNILSKEHEVINGITVTKFVSTFGVLRTLYYEHLDLLGKAKSSLIVDPNNLHIKDLKGQGFNIREIDKKKLGQSKVNAAVVEQTSTMLIKNKATHLIVNAV